jgi:hypothetical protein
VAWADVVIPGEAPRPARVRAARGVVLAALAIWCAAASLSVSMPAFFGTDESAHLAYVAALRSGHLPEIDEDMPVGELDELDALLAHFDRAGTTDDRRDVWVANHPPASYLLALPFVTLGAAVDGGRGPLLAMRLVSASAIALTVVAVGALGARLLPDRPAAAGGAAVLMASLGQVAHIGSLAYSDAVGVLAWTLCLVVAATVVRRPPSGIDGRLAGVSAAVVGLAVLTRASTLPAAGIVGLAWCLALWRAHRAGQSLRAGLQGLVLCAVVPLVVAGPFYLRNRALYGSFTADRFLLDKFDRQRGRPLADQLRAHELYDRIGDEMFGRLRERVTLADGLGTRVAIAVAVGAVLAALLSLRTRPWRPTASGLLLAAGSVVVSLVLLVGVASFRASGGNLHIRYLVPALPVVVVAVAGGLTRLGRRPWLLVPAVAAVALVQGVLLWRYLDLLEQASSTPALSAPAWAPTTSTVLWAMWALLLTVATWWTVWLPAEGGDDPPASQRLTAATSVEATGPTSDHQT